MSLRELARACGVRPFTIQHHFGSKLGLYKEVLSRWDDEVRKRLCLILEEQQDFADVVECVIDDLFDFFLAKRDGMALTTRAVLGEGLPKGAKLEDRSWVHFLEQTLRERRVGALKLDAGLLLITLEGILNHHVLSAAHYRQIFGRDVTEPKLRRRTKKHLKRVILALVGGETTP